MSEQLYDIEHRGVDRAFHRPIDWEPISGGEGLNKLQADRAWFLLGISNHPFTTLEFRIVIHKEVNDDSSK